MKKTQTAVGGTAAAGGGYGIVDNWQTIGSLDWIGDMTPALMLALYLVIIIGGFALFNLWRRVKALEAR